MIIINSIFDSEIIWGSIWLKNYKIISYFKRKSLTNQIIIIIAAIMLVPLLALMYDIFFASRTGEVVFLDKEQRLAGLGQ